MDRKLNEHNFLEGTDLTAVEKFSLQHDFRQISKGDSLYEDLIPKTTPGDGEQYAFNVDLDKCTGCKACVAGCHSENGLEDDEIWRSVGIIHTIEETKPVIQHITSACHHCLDPACLEGCPVDAYEKNPKTGVVKHLDDQCIGCQYCTFKCPYDVPKYNKKKGIVHKCDMCISRLEVGQAPACVRACPNGAITIKIINQAQVRENPTAYVNIPRAPDSNYTLPTTQYQTTKTLSASMVTGDFNKVHLEHSHWPLIVMLVLTQLSVGTLGFSLLAQMFLPFDCQMTFYPYHALVGLGAGILALIVSVFHLGRPLYAFRAVIGLGHSWLSREIVTFGAFAFLAIVLTLRLWIHHDLENVVNILAAATVLVGIFGVFCSVKVYRDTRRPFWDHPVTDVKFFLTTTILGTATVLCSSLIYSELSALQIMKWFGVRFCWIIATCSCAKMILEASFFKYLYDPQQTLLKKSAWIMTEPLKNVTRNRFGWGIVGGIILPVVCATQFMSWNLLGILSCSLLILILSLIAEFCERYLFFRSVVALKMPGGL